MSVVTIPDTLAAQAQREAAELGQSVDELFQTALERHLEDLADSRRIRDFEARRAAGRVELRDWEEVEADLDALDAEEGRA